MSFNNGGNIIAIKKSLAEGWVYKKGSSFDLMCSRRWKPRWTQLILLCGVPGFKYDIPSLLTYWNQSSSEPSSIVSLVHVSTMQIDNDTSDGHLFWFTIIPEGGFTRIFPVSSNERDEWVQVIQIAMRDHQKRMRVYRDKKKEHKSWSHAYDPTPVTHWNIIRRPCSYLLIKLCFDG